MPRPARDLAQLERDGLADTTIVFYFADHGSGMPRIEAFGLQLGPADAAGGLYPRGISQFAARRLSARRLDRSAGELCRFCPHSPQSGRYRAAGVDARARISRSTCRRRRSRIVYGFRGRMDERYDMIRRSATDGRFVYVRNYMPHKIPGQHVSYMFQTPTTQVWEAIARSRKAERGTRSLLEAEAGRRTVRPGHDPDEIDNLAGLPEHQQTLVRLRNAQQNLARTIRDVGFLPEGEIHARSVGTTPYDVGHDEAKYPLERILQAAELASRSDGNALSALPKRCATTIAPCVTGGRWGSSCVVRPPCNQGKSCSPRRLTILGQCTYRGGRVAGALWRTGQSRPGLGPLGQISEL